MTQAAYGYPRKRPADGPLPSVSPTKYARVTTHDKPKTILAYVANALMPGYSGLPMHNKPSSAILPTQNVTARSSATPKNTAVSSKVVAPPPPPKYLQGVPPSDFSEPPRYSASSSSKQPPPPSSAKEPVQCLGSDTSESKRDTPSQPRDRRSSLGSSKGIPSDKATATSSTPNRKSRPKSFHGSTLSHSASWGVIEPPKVNILNSRSWKQLPPSSETASSASSVASTSRITLDSASSWRSTDSNTDRPSSATSQTSTTPYSQSETPQPKQGFSPLPESLFGVNNVSRPSLLLPPVGPLPGTSRISSHASATSSSSTEPPRPSNTFEYTPKHDINGQNWKYKVDCSQEKLSKKQRSRPHIHYAQHKRGVPELWKLARQEMKKHNGRKWWAEAKRKGYEGSEEQFSEFADYTMNAVEAVVLDDMDSNATFEKKVDGYFANPHLFHSIKKFFAAESKPKAIFSPTLEQLSQVVRAKDAAIDHRLRPPRPTLPSRLPQEDEQFVDMTLRKNGFVAKIAREQAGDADIRRLQPCAWLNDEIINFYGALIMARAEAKKDKVARGTILNAFYLSTFFWTKLTNDGYERGKLDRWTKKAKVDIFTKEIVLIPINHRQTHWTVGAINFQKKRFESYDSMALAKGPICGKLREYVDAEHKKKKGKPFDFTGWTDYAPDDVPQQDNGYDCGVFTCQFMESLSRGEDDFVFTQEDMPYLRRRMVWEIAHTKLRSD